MTDLRFWRAKKLPLDACTTLERSFSHDEVVEARTEDRDAFAASQLVSPAYRTYKRRWFGLAQLTLMNIVISWNWLTFALVANFSASYYGVDTSTINWISTIFFLAFVTIFPVTIFVLHQGLKPAFFVAALLILTGNWLRYAASHGPDGGPIALVMLGEVLIGFAQPFILAAPTRFSDLWFTSRGRVAATAVMSLANPLGGALGQLINPLWVAQPSDVSSMVLYVSIISTVCCVPAFFVPSASPSPVGPSSKTPKLNLRESITVVAHSPEIWFILIPFFVYVGFFNSCSALLNQIMSPYGFSDDQAGIGGAILILSGLVFTAVTCPVLDRTKSFTTALKIFVPVTALSYPIFLWMPQTRSVVGPYFTLALLGAASFALLPVVLELLIELSHPLSPEITSTTAWAGGQLFGALFVISDSLKDGDDAEPPRNLRRALIFQAATAMLVSLLPLLLGLFGRKNKPVLRRVRSDERDRADLVITESADARFASG